MNNKTIKCKHNNVGEIERNRSQNQLSNLEKYESKLIFKLKKKNSEQKW